MKFKLWSPRYEDAVIIEGDYMDLAVEQWAETEGHTIVGSGDTYSVFVEDGAGKITTYSVWGEAAPAYHASRYGASSTKNPP